MTVCFLFCVQVFLAPLLSDAQTNEIFVDQLVRLEKMTGTEKVELIDDVGKNLRLLQKALSNQLIIGNNEAKCYAAYFIGEYRFSQSANNLAQVIALHEDFLRPNGRIWVWGQYPAMEALIKIGNPSIPAVIRNLAESDDAKVRELSLKVLYHIEGDKDIVQLRLQKALRTETDLQKQARLQAALKNLDEISFIK